MDEPEDDIQKIRRNPPLYIGSMYECGFIFYLLSPMALLPSDGAKRIYLTVDDGFEIRTDAVIKTEQLDDGRIAPFQVARSYGDLDFSMSVLTALSEELHVSVHTGARLEEWQFARGVLASYGSRASEEGVRGTTLRFKPDKSLFTVSDMSPALMATYLRRLSYLHEGVRFTLSAGGDRREYSTVNGIGELFGAMASPYILMHEPIQVVAHEENLNVKIAMAYHGWKEDHLWCFINNSRAVDGGTHERGIVQALKRLKRKLDLPEGFNNGVVAVASIRYDRRLQFEGSWKAMVVNADLTAAVSRLVFNGVVHWLKDHPAVEAQIRQLKPEPFYFLER